MKKALLLIIVIASCFLGASAQTDSVCAGTTGVSYWVSGLPGSTYTWTIGGGTQVSGSNTDSITVDFSATPGVDTITVIETDTNGCSGEPVKLAVVRLVRPTASIAGSTALCHDSATNLTITLTGNGPWDVTYSDGTNDTTISVNSSPHVVNTTGLTATTTFSLVEIEDTYNCITNPSGGSANVVVTVYPKVVTNPIQHN